MARVYVVQFDQVAVSAAQDLFCIYSAAVTAGKAARLMRVVVSATDTTIPTTQMLAVQVKLLTGTVTAGSAGSAATPQKVDNGDPAATYTARVNDTTPASGTTTQIVYDGGFHAYNGFDESFFADGANPKGAQPTIVGALAAGSAGSAAIQVSLKNATTGTIHLSGSAWFEEIG
jgi:hypothetical protein